MEIEIIRPLFKQYQIEDCLALVKKYLDEPIYHECDFYGIGHSQEINYSYCIFRRRWNIRIGIDIQGIMKFIDDNHDRIFKHPDRKILRKYCIRSFGCRRSYRYLFNYNYDYDLVMIYVRTHKINGEINKHKFYFRISHKAINIDNYHKNIWRLRQ